MKFTDGYWNMRPGIVSHYPVQVHEVEVESDALVAFGVTRKLSYRGAALDIPVITVRFTSPMNNVIRVQITHHKGNLPRKPQFELKTPPKPKVIIDDNDQFGTFTSGHLTARVSKGDDWRVEFLDGDQVITSSGWRAMGYIQSDKGTFVHEQLYLDVGEYVYGLGERFGPFVKNGQSVDIWNEDGGTASEQSYKNIPFYMTNRGYGVLVNHPERVSFEIASEKVERVQFSVPGETLDYYFIYGPSPKDVLERYTALTGRPALPPAWSFGLWLSTSFVTEYDQQTVTDLIQGMQDRDLPLQVFHFDSYWMKELHWCNLEWDKRLFPDPAGMLKRLKARGLNICVWINPYIAQRSAMFDEGVEHGYLLKRPNGDIWQWDRWQAGMAIVDFTNPKACRWYAGKLADLVDMGVDCFKTDFGERIPIDVVYTDGSDPHRMHNFYPYLFNQTVFEMLEKKLGMGKAVVFARSATTGCQQFPVHWGGDCTASFRSMAESLRGGLSLSLSGFGFWSHDIGGFEQNSSADLYKRWCAFGLLSSHSRLHGNTSYRVPWLYDDEAVDVLRFFTNLKCRLMPYILYAACEAHETGVPVMRSMILEFPDDPGCDTLDRQYMLGESLLVAPIFNADGVVDYYLPQGQWTNLLNSQVVEGGRWIRETHDYLSLPLMVRPNTVLPMGANDKQSDYNYADGIVFHVFQLDDGAAVTTRVPKVNGAVAMSVTASRNGQQIAVETEGKSRGWSILLRGIKAVQRVSDGTAEDNPLGILVTPKEGSAHLTIEL